MARSGRAHAGLPDTKEQLISTRTGCSEYARDHLFGADFDPFLVRTSSMSVMMLTGKPGNIFYMDSLAFPGGHLPGSDEAKRAHPARQRRRADDQPAVRHRHQDRGPGRPRHVPRRGGKVRGPATRRPARSAPGRTPSPRWRRSNCSSSGRSVGQARRADRHRPAERHPVQPRTHRRGHPQLDPAKLLGPGQCRAPGGRPSSTRLASTS